MELRIAICDDEPKYRSILHEKIVKDSFENNYETTIAEYSCGRELTEAFDEGLAFDVYFLDIQMENGTDDGIRLAKELRSRGENGLIIYVTSFIDYVQTGYEVKAFRYLLKSQIEEKLTDVLGDVRKELVGEEYLSIKIGGEIIRVSKPRIMFLESNKRRLKLYTDSGDEHCFYGSMDSMQAELGGRFIRCHRSYMVNMTYIKGWSSELIELKCGTTIPISRSFAKEVKQRLMLELV